MTTIAAIDPDWLFRLAAIVIIVIGTIRVFTLPPPKKPPCDCIPNDQQNSDECNDHNSHPPPAPPPPPPDIAHPETRGGLGILTK